MGFFSKLKAYLNEEEPAEKPIGETTEHAAEDTTDDLTDEPSAKGRFSKRKAKRALKQVSKEQSSEQISTHPKHGILDERQAVQDFCEQLVDVTNHMEEIKTEYRIVTNYLTDIQRIEELPIEAAEDINATAQMILQLDADRQAYLESEKLLPLEQYNTMAAYEDEVFDTIKKLNEMEMRDSMLKSDMGHLEGEKESLKYVRADDADRIERLRGVIITILVLFMLTSIGLFVYAASAKKAVTLYALAVGAFAVVAFAIAYARYVDIRKEVRESEAKLNRAISLLNKVKVKYINNVNTMEYIYRKYGVNSCKELEYRNELYQKMVRDEKRFDRADNDLRVQQERLEKKLDRIGVRDTGVWLSQVHAFVERSELTGIKQALMERRRNLSNRMTISEKIRDNACTALRAALADNPGMEEVINESLSPHNIAVN
ncbi:MAG: hypothetical protein PUB54_07865 [Lachnospiraceae bacterium]|nr:hypothetical protein [Lachnospiraceae bacterium]